MIVGGGAVGASVAFHLARAGEDVLLLEQSAVSGGTTWHAAGMVGRMRPNGTLARLNDASARLYGDLEDLTGVPTGWRRCGTLYVARNAERMVQYRRQAAMASHFGIEVDVLGPAEAAGLFPLQHADDIVGGIHVPADGKVEPGSLCRSLAAGAVQAGARVVEGVRVQEPVRRGRAVTGVRLEDGREVEAEHVVLAAGMWSRALGAAVGVDVPLAPVEHHYVVSNPVAAHTAEEMDAWPCTRDTDGAIYYRTDGNRIWLGAFQAYTKAWQADPIPHPFSFALLDPDWEHFAPPRAEGEHRLPVLRSVGYERFVNGPESFTPDANFLLGPAAGAPGLWIAAGMNSAGIAFAGGAGQALAAWIVDGHQPLDLSGLDPARFSPAENGRRFLRRRVTEALGVHYAVAWPNRELESGRPLRTSPLHRRLLEAGACYGQKAGLERPNWFGRPGIPPVQTYGWGRQPWFDAVREEHLGCRGRVAVFDQSGFGKLEVVGPDAAAVLGRLCANDVDVEPGRVVYTAMLDDLGRFRSDLTVIRLDETRFRLVTGTAQRVRDRSTLEDEIRADERCAVVDVTAGYAVLGVTGPHSRALLADVSDDDLGNEAFPFGTVREIAVADAVCLAVRITYVGELGWELHVPADQALVAYDALAAMGEEHGRVDAGHYALNALRLEKAYRAWGAELAPDVTPLEAGLAFAVAWDKPGGFRGRDALLRQRAAGPPSRRLVSLLAEDPDAVLWGGEPILHDGVPVGYTSSAAYGHALGGAVALGYVGGSETPVEALLADGALAVRLPDRVVPMRGSLRPFYDPTRARILDVPAAQAVS